MTKKTRKKIHELEETIEFLKFKIMNPNLNFVVCIESAPIFRCSYSIKEYELKIKKIYMDKVITLSMPLGIFNGFLGYRVNGEYIEIHKEREYLTEKCFSKPSQTLYRVIQVVGNTLSEIPTDLYAAAMRNKK